jgi:hypothetical protein
MESGNGTSQAPATPGGAHARDLGYLDKFLEKLRLEAAAMPRGDARTRLEALLSEETDRWREIAALLETSSVASSSSGASEPVAAASRSPVATHSATGQREWKPRVTIGSLKRPPG